MPTNLSYITVATPLLIFITADKPRSPGSNSASISDHSHQDQRLPLHRLHSSPTCLTAVSTTTFHGNHDCLGHYNNTTLLPNPLCFQDLSLTILLAVNDARAMRVAEIMTDFRNLQHYLSQLRATPTAEEYYLEGYSLLRQCTSEAQTILQTPFSASTGATTGDPERERQQLKT